MMMTMVIHRIAVIINRSLNIKGNLCNSGMNEKFLIPKITIYCNMGIDSNRKDCCPCLVLARCS